MADVPLVDEQHAHLLTPAFALSGTLPPSYETMTPAELEAMLAEMEPDIRAADRDLREIELLEKKDITGAGKLPDYEALQPRLDALMKAHEEDLHKAADLEKRIASLMNRYATNVRSCLYELSHRLDVSYRWTRCLNCLSLGTTHFGMRRSRPQGWRRSMRSRSDLVLYDTPQCRICTCIPEIPAFLQQFTSTFESKIRV